jgi:hypothetical protein
MIGYTFIGIRKLSNRGISNIRHQNTGNSAEKTQILLYLGSKETIRINLVASIKSNYITSIASLTYFNDTKGMS